MEPDWIEIETRLAFQDDHLRQLDLSQARQQQEIDALRRDLAELLGLVRDLASSRAEAGPDAKEPPPPHY